MGVAQALTAIVLSLAAPAAAVPQTTDPSALQAVASSCAGATTPAGGLQAMFCGINVVRNAYRLRALRSKGKLKSSSLMKADALHLWGSPHHPWCLWFRRNLD